MHSRSEVGRFFRFIAVGLLNTLFGYLVFAVLIIFAMPTQPALLLATIVGIAFNYHTTGSLVFGETGGGAFWRFIAVYGASYTLNAIGLAELSAIGIGPLAAQLALTPIVMMVTYMSLRFLVFSRRHM